jgi:hypothetical protein
VADAAHDVHRRRADGSHDALVIEAQSPRGAAAATDDEDVDLAAPAGERDRLAKRRRRVDSWTTLG